MGPTQPLFPNSLLHQSSLISSAGSPAACTMALHISPGLRRGHSSSHRWEKDRAPIAFHTWALPRRLLPTLLLPWCQPPRDGSAHTHHDHRSPSRGSPPVHLRNGFSCLQTGKAVRRPGLAVVVHRGYIACNREQTNINERQRMSWPPVASLLCGSDSTGISDCTCAQLHSSHLTTTVENSYQEAFQDLTLAELRNTLEQIV